MPVGLVCGLILQTLALGCTSAPGTPPPVTAAATPRTTSTSTSTPAATPPTATPTSVSDSDRNFRSLWRFKKEPARFRLRLAPRKLHRSGTTVTGSTGLRRLPTPIGPNACSVVPLTAASPALATGGGAVEMYCQLEAAELDLYFNQMTISWSAPASACAYVEVKPFWFYRYQALMEPGTNTYAYTVDSTVTPSSTTHF